MRLGISEKERRQRSLWSCEQGDWNREMCGHDGKSKVRRKLTLGREDTSTEIQAAYKHLS